MSLLIASLLLSLLAVLIGWLATRRDPAGSPLLTLGSLLLLLSLPLLMLLPKVTVEVSAAPDQTAALSGTALPIFGVLWIVGFLFAAFRMTRDYCALRRWFSASSECEDPTLHALLKDCRSQLGLDRNIPIHLCPGQGSPCIAGLLHPVLYLPETSRFWSGQTLRMVLLHELGHLARRDLWTALAARLTCLVHWFNPLVWWLRRHLLAQCEYACDARVIAAGADPKDYVNALCDVAESGREPQTALAMAGSAPLRRRVERLIARPTHRHRLLVGSTLLLTATTSLALSVLRFSPAPPIDPPYTPEEINLRLTADPFPAD
ncbi:MAG: M56 family metallopeptidase [Verrucomicrobia bacterium]|nr:M56 family metallopeptidase [Verrucomicrobiota bacterium]